ncbi:hypothetical protein LMG31886_41960 [Xanthomonas hydrangeae]|nr:hypothetical protein LMG31884_43010 [Xanthomonas hydrangeae]CAD7729039.1 hypothetical protein LMG31884_43010 [Xanthomonas hydrangeae]CAD7732718.1 hypothetical protein LMG31885_18430 [Xanthomonas hydrangeae]CAD7732721.1 hypothetical protein LMG31885_18430 [Xanthomonas hydrangeae]CAD7744539.1 hypothetical protein LMG31887_42930 [Xanthomonas hydrangeae]
MDAATEPPGTGSRRVPRAARAPRTRRTELLIQAPGRNRTTSTVPGLGCFVRCVVRVWKVRMDQRQSGRSGAWLQGPCPPTIAGHAVNPSMEALTRHPCRVRSRDGARARTSRDGRCAWESGAGCALFDHEASASCLMRVAVQTAFQTSADQLSGAVSSPVAGPCGGMDAATEPPGTGSRRVPQAVRAPRPRRCEFLLQGPRPQRPIEGGGAHLDSAVASLLL